VRRGSEKQQRLGAIGYDLAKFGQPFSGIAVFGAFGNFSWPLSELSFGPT